MPLKEKDMISMSDPRVTLIGHPAPAWMVNYADLMTELVCFFIILYALSAALNKDMVKAKQQVEETMKMEGVSGNVKVDKDGMIVTVQEKDETVLFDSGSAELSDTMRDILSKVGPSLKTLADTGHEIVVEGHTDNIPLRKGNSRYPSNWELSSARATNVVRELINHQGFPPPQMGAIGYGENRPVADNDTDEHRASNRRVVFFIKNKPFKPDPLPKEGETAEAEETAVTVSDDVAEQPPAEEAPPPETASTEGELPLNKEASE